MKRSNLTCGTIVAFATAAAGAWLWSGVSSGRCRRLGRDRGHTGQLSSLWSVIGGCRIHALASAGSVVDSPPVILVHGFGISSSYFVPTAEQLAEEFAVYAPDLPGHGKSDTPPEPLDVSQLADSLIAWMRSAGLPRAVLLGHSMGCQIVIDAAARYVEHVDRVVLVGLTPEPGGRTLAELLRRSLVAGWYERPSLNVLLVKDYIRMGRRLPAELRFMLADRPEDKLGGVRAPAKLIRGERDTIAASPWYREVARRLRAGEVTVIGGWGHAVNYSAPQQLAAAVAPFLRSARGCGQDAPRC